MYIFLLNCFSEVEKFILDNTQELAKDKWLCPLSGKKFKGPDFVRKHLLNKHADRVDEVRKQVLFLSLISSLLKTYIRSRGRKWTIVLN